MVRQGIASPSGVKTLRSSTLRPSAIERIAMDTFVCHYNLARRAEEIWQNGRWTKRDKVSRTPDSSWPFIEMHFPSLPKVI